MGVIYIYIADSGNKIIVHSLHCGWEAFIHQVLDISMVIPLFTTLYTNE